MVGQTLLRTLEERDLNPDELLLVASQRSVGKEIHWKDEVHRVIGMEEALERKPDLALFSAGGETSLKYAPQFAEVGCCVIDNSSAWRMDEEVKLIVPEVNGDSLDGNEKIIANPNCSTIQLVTALNNIHRQLKIQRLVISTYQSITGTGQSAVRQYDDERHGLASDTERPYPHRIFENCLPHCDIFLENDYTKEEMKLVYETRKILDDPSIRITATAVRVPVKGGHSESVNVEIANDLEIDNVKAIFEESDGVVLMDDVRNNVYPMPLSSYGKDEVFVGRVRKDESQPNTFNCWIVADNLRKGAATNAVQIAERMIEIWSDAK